MNTNETIDEIIVKIRSDIKSGSNYYAANLPDRIEAAVLREKVVAATIAASEAIRLTDEKWKRSSGNITKMREVLLRAKKNFDAIGKSALSGEVMMDALTIACASMSEQIEAVLSDTK